MRSTRRSFRDRADAGRRLAGALTHLSGGDAVVLALPRGGVPVAAEVAAALGAHLDVFVVRKLGVPGHEELAMGAIAMGGVRVVNDEVVRSLGIDHAAIDAAVEREAKELARREAVYRDGRPLPAVDGRTVVLVDDGLATGATMRAAVEAARRLRPARLVVAVPAGAPATCRALRLLADEVVCLVEPEGFTAVGAHYEDFSQTSDDEVRAILASAGRRTTAHAFEEAVARRGGGHRWRRTSAAGEWRSAGEDGTGEAVVRQVAGGAYEASVYEHATGPTPGPEPPLAHGPQVFEDPDAALEFCESNLSP